MSSALQNKTAAYHTRHSLPDHARCELGRTGLIASRLGFGGYRVDEITAAHAEALKLALRSGINLIDTSTNPVRDAEIILEFLAKHLARS